MKEKNIVLSLGILFAFPAIINPFVKQTDIVSNDAENVTQVVQEKAKAFEPYAYLNEKLTNVKAQHITEEKNGYWSDIDMNGTINYDKVQGISTFRGSNYRQNAFYGVANIKEKIFEKIWTNNIGYTDSWTGVGWNGQPSIIRWDNDTKLQMNIYNEFKEKENFTEVIIGGLDSIVHFYDLDTGLPSRPAIKVPSSIKGSITVDPRGYPLLYVGQGIDAVNGTPVKMGYHIFSLINGEELLFIDGRDKFAYRGWGAFDGNPVIDAITDTMILPGENGIIYIVKLNTKYDKKVGTISITPVITRYRYTKNGKSGGVEDAITIYKKYAFFADNNGVVQALELSSLSPVWTFDMGDDCDATIGIEEENGEAFLYVGCEVDKRKTNSPAFVRKLNGRTGDKIWEYSCNCMYDGNTNGGVLSSPIIGQKNIADLVIFNFSKVTSLRNGKIVALNKSDGKVVWEKDLNFYSWSSPVAIYDEKGDAYIILCDFNGVITLIDARTGETITSLQTGGGNVEGSPAVFDNHIIFGTRGKKVYRIDIK